MEGSSIIFNKAFIEFLFKNSMLSIKTNLGLSLKEDLLSVKALEEVGVFDTKIIRSVWNDHVTGKHNRQYQLWGPLMFQSWAKEML